MIADVDNIFGEEDANDAAGDNNCYHRIQKQLKTDDQFAPKHTHDLDTARVIVTLKQIIRDWSKEGEEERRACYDPILQALTENFRNTADRSQIKVLVPGAGLGRLTYEIARCGFFSEGNEFSYFMLIGANFILNQCLYDNQYTFYPYIHQTVNNFRATDPAREAKFPDVSAIQNPPSGTMNMVAGDFLQVYTQVDYWDCVATSFFIDCANNVIDFIEAIYKYEIFCYSIDRLLQSTSIFSILKPGGIWINLGPLLYHYHDCESENSIEPSYEDLVEIIKTVGFEIMTNDTNVQTKYTQNRRSMYQSTYSSIFLVCRKNAQTISTSPAVVSAASL